MLQHHHHHHHHQHHKAIRKASLSKGINNDDVKAESEAVLSAKRWAELTNEHDFDGLTFLYSSKCLVHFPEIEILAECFIEEGHKLALSFPDFHVSYQSVQEIKPGVALIQGVRASGTHTGVPYAFGPYPPIEPKGIRAINDPEDTYVHVGKNGFITKLEFKPRGPQTGLIGFYEQIGGITF